MTCGKGVGITLMKARVFRKLCQWWNGMTYGKGVGITLMKARVFRKLRQWWKDMTYGKCVGIAFMKARVCRGAATMMTRYGVRLVRQGDTAASSQWVCRNAPPQNGL